MIGAGPSGAMAARRLSLAGARVLLVEKKRFPRSKVCGACLSRAALAELHLAGLGSLPGQLGAIDLVELELRFRGKLLRMKLGGGAAVSRERFDAELAARAVDAGCRFLEGTLAVVEAASGGLRTVRLMQHGHEASGGDQDRPRCRRIGSLRFTVEASTAHRTTVKEGSRIGAGCRIARPPGAYASGALVMAIGAGGYVGMVRVEDGSLNVAAAFDPALVRMMRTPGAAACEILAEAGAPELSGLKGAEWQGTPGLTRRTRPLAHERLFFLGDAAGYVEPFTGEGIAWALAAARAVEPIALEAIKGWQPRLARDWSRAHRRLVVKPAASSLCRLRRRPGLRQPWLIRAGFEILNRAPLAAGGAMRLLYKTSLYSTASRPWPS